MYATIPEAEAKQPKNQAPARRGFGRVVALLNKTHTKS